MSVWWCLGGRAADPAAVRANQALHLDGGGGLHRGGGVHLRSSTGTQAWSFFYFATFMRAPLPLPLEWFLTQQHVLIIIYYVKLYFPFLYLVFSSFHVLNSII